MNPFEFSCPIKSQCPMKSESKISSYLFPVLILIIVGFMMIAINIETSYTYDNIDMNLKVIKDDEYNKDYRYEQLTRDGTTRLVKGKIKVIHHNIKKDSTIILSRKNIEGKIGMHLIIGDIIPNEYFEILSIDNDGNIQEEDYGEVYYIIN